MYRLYFGALLGQMAAFNMQMIARSLLIWRLTGSAAILGAISLANAIPLLLLSLFGGVIADRVQKKYVILLGQLGSAVVALGVALALTFGYLSPEVSGSWWILVVASVFQGTIFGLMMPSRQAILPEIVGDEHLHDGVGIGQLWHLRRRADGRDHRGANSSWRVRGGSCLPVHPGVGLPPPATEAGLAIVESPVR